MRTNDAITRQSQVRPIGRVFVERISMRRGVSHFRTVFSVESQSFILADSDDPQEALHHCKFIQKMFALAARKAGMRVVLARKIR